MNELLFEWDQNKNILNQKKHNISFEEARTVFLDDNALLIDDPDHSQEEDRFILLGFSLRAKLLVVCHCYRHSENVIRLISARKATKSEASAYTKNREWGDWDERRIWFQQRNKKSLRKKNKKTDYYQHWFRYYWLFQEIVCKFRYSIPDVNQSLPIWLCYSK